MGRFTIHCIDYRNISFWRKTGVNEKAFLGFKIVLPMSDQRKHVDLKRYEIDFLTDTGEIVSPHSCRRGLSPFLIPMIDDERSIQYNTTTYVDCTTGRKPNDPSVDKIRLTFYVEVIEGMKIVSLAYIKLTKYPSCFY